MRKIGLIALLIMLNGKVYASSGNYFGGWLFDINKLIPAGFSQNFVFGKDILQSSPIDNLSDLEGRVRVVRLPYNLIVRGKNDCFTGAFRDNNLIREEPVTELVHLIELDRNSILLRDDVRNTVINNTVQYNRISIYIDESDQDNPVVEIFLDKNAKKTKEATTGIVAFISALGRYGRSDVSEKLKNEGFFE